MAIAGKVAITSGGEWSDIIAYDKLVVVTFRNNVYLSIKPSTGIEPTNEEYWMLLIENVTQEQYESILNGTTAVGNALKVNGLTAEQVGESGAKNLIPYPHASTTKTASGITWTDNGDGTITANGTATATSRYYCNQDITIKAGTYTLSGCPKGGGASVYEVNIWDGSKVYARDIGNGETVTLETDIVTDISLAIRSGVTVENLVFKPMLNYGAVACAWKPYYSGGAEKAKDADTVDGYHASDLVRKFQGWGREYFGSANINTWISDGVYAYQGGDTNQPHGDWGTIQILAPLKSDRVTQIGYDWNEAYQPFRIRYSNDGGANWSEWDYLNASVLAKYLPLDGSVPMSGVLKLGNDTQILLAEIHGGGEGGYIDFFSEGNRVGGITVNKNGNFVFYDTGAREILHTGNSQKVVTSASAPSDTSAVWIDSANKVSKIYIDGAWTALA